LGAAPALESPGRELWEPIRGAVRQQAMPVHSVVVLQQPVDLAQRFDGITVANWALQRA